MSLTTIPTAPTQEQLALMNEAWDYDNVTKVGTTGTIGMFGVESDDSYWFWFEFVPLGDVLDASAVVYMWFQMGTTGSDWEGVTLDNGGTALAADTNMLPLSATNSVYASEAVANYDDDSTFEGAIIYDATNPKIQIWRQTLKTEQDDADGEVDRIEYGRELKITYEIVSRTTFTVTLTGAMPGLVASATALLASLLFLG